MKNNHLSLFRNYHEDVTFGKLTMPSGTVFDTIELPWKDNEAEVSCIPEGVYKLEKRESDVVRRTTKGKYTLGWEVTNVEGRTYIMIHIANFTKDIIGCIGIGLGRGEIGGEQAILNSAKAFDQFMKEMEAYDTWYMVIQESPE